MPLPPNRPSISSPNDPREPAYKALDADVFTKVWAENSALTARSAKSLHSVGVLRHWTEGQVLLSRGQSTSTALLLVKGRLRVSVTTPEGEEQLLRWMLPGEISGLSSVFAETTYPADLVAVGKRSGRPSPKQDHVSRLLVDHARTGARVAATASQESSRTAELLTLAGRLEAVLRGVEADYGQAFVAGGPALQQALRPSRLALSDTAERFQALVQAMAAEGTLERDRAALQVEYHLLLENLRQTWQVGLHALQARACAAVVVVPPGLRGRGLEQRQAARRVDDDQAVDLVRVGDTHFQRHAAAGGHAQQRPDQQERHQQQLLERQRGRPPCGARQAAARTARRFPRDLR